MTATAAEGRSGAIALPAGRFRMGSESGCRPEDGEGPVRAVRISAFALDSCAVSSATFGAFVQDTGYVTQAEAFGWSFAFDPQGATLDRPGSWWKRTEGACWRCPEGPGSDLSGRANHPVTHVSWNDAVAYATWAGGHLPTEAQWEYAARGGLRQMPFPWGRTPPTRRYRANIWRGVFPQENSAADGYVRTCPVAAFRPNRFGFYNMVGNVWEWTADWFSRDYHAKSGIGRDPTGPPFGEGKVLKGGSYLCHKSYCARYRVSSRMGSAPDVTTAHVGFRVAYSLSEPAS